MEEWIHQALPIGFIVYVILDFIWKVRMERRIENLEKK